jgi:hypothetical protein
MSSRTWSIGTARLLADKEAASVVLRLMIALNDLAMANEGLGEWIATQERRKLARQNGGRLYYGRMLMAHVYEALSIIEDIQDSPKLRMLVDACDPATRWSFNGVAVFLKTADYGMLRRIRNNASFHYDGKLAVRALEQINKKFPEHISTYSLGHDPLDWYFEARWFSAGQDRNAGHLQSAGECWPARRNNPNLVKMHTMAGAFRDFAGHFIRNQLKRQ